MKRTPELGLGRARQAVRVCACFNLRRAARSVTQIYDAALAPLGLSSGQFVLLLAVRLHGETSLLQLAGTVWAERSVLSRTVRPLRARGLLKIVTGRDRRTRKVTLTAAGHRALAEGYPCWQRAQARLTVLLGGAQLGRLLGTLDRSMRDLQPGVRAPARHPPRPPAAGPLRARRRPR